MSLTTTKTKKSNLCIKISNPKLSQFQKKISQNNIQKGQKFHFKDLIMLNFEKGRLYKFAEFFRKI
jgi:hypothetical protein